MNTIDIIAPDNEQIRPASKPLRVIGIDLGTTNSAVAEIVLPADTIQLPKARRLEIAQPTEMGSYTSELVPSVVAVRKGETVVGEGAKRLLPRMSEEGLEQCRDIFWECKNDIGVRRTYHKAPEGFRSAKEISGHILKFLHEAALEESDQPIDAAAVTAPASFQTPQRMDTIEAAETAGIDLGGGALLDEPIAAFIAYLADQGRSAFGEINSRKRLVVFDFGGGTCDIALFELLPPETKGRPLGVAPLSVSRYHRLGGGDIDREIAVQFLLPQLIEQNNLGENDLDYHAKSRFVIPALLRVAENLKIGVSKEIARLKQLGEYEEQRGSTFKELPSRYTCRAKVGPDDSKVEKELKLQSPKLTAEQFEKAVEPFLDNDLLFPREFDYNMTCSIFAPLQNALNRAELEPADIDYCLMVGGSSLIPQVSEAVESFLNEAQVLRFDEPSRHQTAIAEGAAYQALSLALFGQGIVHPAASCDIRIQTSSGPKLLIRRGAQLPYPSDGDLAENTDLLAPRTAGSENAEIRVELTDENEKVLTTRTWGIPPQVRKGDRLRLRYRMDLNQHLLVHLSVIKYPECKLVLDLENPVTHVVNPNAKRDQILELEEKMRVESMPLSQQKETVMEIAALEKELGKNEKALSLLSALNQHSPDPYLLNRMGILAYEMRDYDRAEKYYIESSRISSNPAEVLFNLALLQDQIDEFEKAEQNIQRAISLNPKPPYYILQARIVLKQGRKSEADAILTSALNRFGPVELMSDWELNWYLSGVRQLNDEARMQAIAAERSRRRRWDFIENLTHDGDLPDYKEHNPSALS